MHKRDNAIQDITQITELEEIINKSKVCHVGMVDGNRPYVLAFNFGYKDKTIYLHCAKYGKKLDVLAQNNNVCVEFDTDHYLFARHEQVACSWRMKYRSVLAHGKAVFVEDYDKKIDALNIIMKQYSDKDFSYSKPSIDNILIIEIKIEEFTGRKFEWDYS